MKHCIILGCVLGLKENGSHLLIIGFMPSCTTSWTSASSLFPVCHYWTNWLIQVSQQQ